MPQVVVTNKIWRILKTDVVSALGLNPVIAWGWDGRFLVTQHAQTVNHNPPNVPPQFDLLTDHWTKTRWVEIRDQWFSSVDPGVFHSMRVYFDADHMYFDLDEPR